MAEELPDFLTHYSRGDPFRSLTSEPPDRWPEIVAGFSDANTWGVARFADPDYLSRRKDVEDRLREEFIARGGKPKLQHPTYCMLGTNPAWEKQKRPGMRAYRVPLSLIPPDSISFTLGDSLLGYDPTYRAQVAETRDLYRTRFVGRVFCLGELTELWGLAASGSVSVDASEFPTCLEAQLWVLPPLDRVQVLEL